MVNDLVGELLGLRNSHARFREVGENQVLHAANCFVRYKMRSLESIKRATREARRYFSDDLRKVERLGFPQVAFIIELFDHLPVNLQTETPGRRGWFQSSMVSYFKIVRSAERIIFPHMQTPLSFS